MVVGAAKLFAFTRYVKNKWKPFRSECAGLREEFKRWIKMSAAKGVETAAMLLLALLARANDHRQDRRLAKPRRMAV